MVTPRIFGALLVVAALAGCSGQPDSAASGGAPGDRVAALHTAAECLRHHGVNNFADPVLGANGQVYTDMRPLQEASQDGAQAARDACRAALATANWNPEQQPPAPAALVEAGVKAAQCMRAHGLPNYHDPNATTGYTPGHGFGIQANDLPPGADKQTPAVRQALQACRTLLDAEITASRLDHLAGR